MKLFTPLFLILFFAVNGDAKSTLTLKDYLAQVSSQNDSYRSASMLQKAYELRTAEANLQFAPQFLGNASYLDDKKPPLTASNPIDTVNESFSLGVQDKMRTGTLVNLSYAVSNTMLYYSPGVLAQIPAQFALFLPPTQYWYAGPVLSVTQALWKDFGGSLSTATEEALVESYRSLALTQKFSAQQIAFNAEAAYWRLSLLREVVDFDNQSLDRTAKILAWNKRRVAMNVADQSDLLQAQAAYSAKQLQLETDLQSETDASIAFNSLRNVRGNSVAESLDATDGSLGVIKDVELKRVAERLDILATQATAKSAAAASRVGGENVKPDLNFTGSVALNGMNSALDQASGQSFQTNYPTYAVGLKLTVPLDWDLTGKVKESYHAATTAAEAQVASARFNLDQDWQALQIKFKDTVKRLSMAKDLEDLQGEKLKHERVRFNSGRTTSFQVLQFEEDFSNSQLNRLRVESEILGIRAQARLYNGESL